MRKPKDKETEIYRVHWKNMILYFRYKILQKNYGLKCSAVVQEIRQFQFQKFSSGDIKGVVNRRCQPSEKSQKAIGGGRSNNSFPSENSKKMQCPPIYFGQKTIFFEKKNNTINIDLRLLVMLDKPNSSSFVTVFIHEQLNLISILGANSQTYA